MGSRLSHVIRIFGTNKNGDVIQDIWLDIERIDVFASTEQVNGFWQGVMRRLYWLDDVDDTVTGGLGNDARIRGTLKICSPDDDPNDPEEWIPVAINVEMIFAEGNGSTVVRGNRNDAENLSRTVAARRVYQQDTTIDDAVQSAIDDNPDRKSYVVASNEYDFVKDSIDKESFIETQVMSFTLEQHNSETVGNADSSAGADQDALFILRSEYLLNFTDEAKGPVNPDHGFDPPWALDPFQNIVNVDMGGLAVEFLDQSA